MARFAPDSSCMIPALLPNHVHHTRAVAAINGRLDSGETMRIVAHTILETYSTLTRMPPPFRVSASSALRAIEQTYLVQGTVVAWRSEEYVGLLHELANGGTVGGQVYDAAIAACARWAGADMILTFNERHCRPFASDDLAIVVP